MDPCYESQYFYMFWWFSHEKYRVEQQAPMKSPLSTFQSLAFWDVWNRQAAMGNLDSFKVVAKKKHIPQLVVFDFGSSIDNW